MNLIRRLFDKILSLLFPERCVICDRVISAGENGLCPQCRNKIVYIKDPKCFKCGKQIRDELARFCTDCQSKKHIYDRGRALCVYNEPVRKSIYRFKYGNRQRYALFYGHMLTMKYIDEIVSWHADALIPIPIHKDRYRERGFNQALLLAKVIAEKTGIPVLDSIVYRVRYTKAQKLLNAMERQNNLKGAFKICRNDVKLNTVIVIDDIYTTGATIDEVSRLLRSFGVDKIYFLTIASGDGN